MTARAHLGLNIYVWGRDHQDRVLVDWLVPLAERLTRDDRLERVWYDRFDARGPHLICLLTPPPSVSVSTLRATVAPQLTEYLESAPSTDVLTDAELAARHEECRDKALCSIDMQPGIAANNTFIAFEQDDRGYPFAIAERLPDADEYWRLNGRQTTWVLEQLVRGKASAGTAIRWLAALDTELSRAGQDTEDCWRYHAGTLLPNLQDPESKTQSALLEWVGEKNARIFSNVWEKVEALPETWPHLRQLAQVAVVRDAPTPMERWMALRELAHTTLKQLGLPVRLHVPLILFAWSRTLRPA